MKIANELASESIEDYEVRIWETFFGKQREIMSYSILYTRAFIAS